MRIPGLARIRLAARRIHNRFSTGALILLYHRVMRLDSDPQWLAVPPDLFERQMEMLAMNWRVISLADLVQSLRDNVLPNRALVLTFDDGYVDNLQHARPILERFGLPATIFVASGFVGRREEFFWDELDRLLLLTRKTGTLKILGTTYDLSESAPTSPGWNVLKDAPSPRHDAYRAICAQIASLDHPAREEALNQIRAWTGETSTGRESHRTVTENELVQLATGGLIEIGAHTVTHPSLATLPVERQRDEIEGSKRRLESILNQPVSAFSYPFGLPTDFSTDTMELTRLAGFNAACANFGGTVRKNADLMQLNRILVRDWGPDELDRRLREAFYE